MKEDELIVTQKANAIVECFIDSQIPPRIQVALLTYSLKLMHIAGGLYWVINISTLAEIKITIQEGKDKEDEEFYF